VSIKDTGLGSYVADFCSLTGINFTDRTTSYSFESHFGPVCLDFSHAFPYQ